ncbi:MULTISPECIES: SMU1112c/YaeR family gloxylase I-like metalloprotein [Heyndrickxia]|uniref:Glyoxalase/bleomycin resistance protein/dioxygenase n=3 Tax=Heyndrickxia TaxID=2837504 RepID=G2TQB1_HEYCO|nr:MULTISPECIES: VOC family protein [Heyndrickxia]AEO99759.1 Glyoxalase/bleomycin resistance protein/dioxygenase [Heyndrickxia coagulans 36D1]AVD55369.1 VOC family protein [Heyndrickxia coagulans]AWP36236.1 VOC family protein [Heyndrickxia coagulans]KWZ82919.1 glyoxalase family protein [Heyndrickxia coagulans]MED4920934.1 VOC family protein [Weizmannia sp. CD-2023]
MAAPRLKRIHHIAIICSDYAKSKHFYVDCLGLEPVREVYRKERDSYKLDLSVGGVYQIELFSFPDPPARPTFPEAAGLRHLAFETDDVEADKKRLEEMGIQVEDIRIDPLTDKKFTFFQDPDGLPIELYES